MLAKIRISAVVAAVLCTASCHVLAKEKYNIVTASENGTYIEFGRDLAKYVAEPADIELKALTSNGSIENIRRMRYEAGTRLALVQSDVYQAFKDQAAAGHAEAMNLVSPLRVIAPLYDEEIYFIVRADSPLKSIQDIRGTRINIGPGGSGSAMTATTLYKLMFDVPMPEANVTTFQNEEALVKMAKDKTVDVVVIVAGQPAALFSRAEPGVEKFFKLLPLDESDPVSARAMTAYPKATIKAVNHPNWLASDITGLSVKTLLVTYDYNLKQTRDSLVKLTKSLCDNLPLLQKEGHPKWKQVSLQLPPLSKGLTYYPPTEHALKGCRYLKPKWEATCGLREKVMGLCTGDQ